MDLYTAGHRRGIAAAPHHAAAETGRMILAEGEYKIIARNNNKVYQQDLTVIPGVDSEIEVLAR